MFLRSGYKQKVKEIVQGALFPEAGLNKAVGHAGGTGGLVVVQGLDLFSYCESCLLPFEVTCHVAYVPSGETVVGLSKFSRVADVFAKRLQNPQHLADEICAALHHEIKPAGVAVLLQCSHINFPNLESFFLSTNHQDCMKALVSSSSGVFVNDNAHRWGDFLSLLKFKGINVNKNHIENSNEKCWCPVNSSISKVSSKTELPNPEMVNAVATILGSLVEDPSRMELIDTPSHYVKWLLNFQNTNLDMKLNGFVWGRTDLVKVNGEVGHVKERIHSEVNLSLWSLCEHHLLPFYGVVHIGYFSDEEFNPIGRSLLQSIVHFYGFKLQVQERLTKQIAETVSSLFGGDVMVLVVASHTCMMTRGIEKIRSSTTTSAELGRFSTDRDAREMFMESIQKTTATAGL